LPVAIEQSAYIEVPYKTGTICALSYTCTGIDGLGGKGLQNRPHPNNSASETDTLNMQPASFEEAVRKIAESDRRYPVEAYCFVQEALQHTQRALGRHKTEDKHVGGKELLAGIREYALKTFGPMVLTVFGEWNIHSCEDFGEIVFNMVEHHLYAKTTSDNRKDFRAGYDFDEAFGKPFRPSRRTPPAPKPDEAEAGVKPD
jgi:uncharacterized repeat protein (TIGR04138 family)